MAGGLIQLVAQGVQDLYLTGDPQITFFKAVYRRHSNFSIESMVQNFDHAANFGKTVSCVISRSGDLIGKIFLSVKIPSIPKFIDPETGIENNIMKIAWVNNLGYALIKDIQFEIDGQLIDKQYGEWMYLWSQVSGKQNTAINKMVGNVEQMYQFSNGKSAYQLYIPLEFWFCRNTGLYLPLVALTSCDIKLTVTFRKIEECYRIGPTNSIEIVEDVIPFVPGDYIEQIINNETIYGYMVDYDYLQKKLYYIKIHSPSSNLKSFGLTDRIYNSSNGAYCTIQPGAKEMVENTSLFESLDMITAFFYVDYIFLDNDERAKITNNNHEYLIEQLQFNQDTGIKSPNVKQKLVLKHPCKSFFWIAQLDSLVGPGTINDRFNYTNSPVHYNKPLILETKLVLNGKSRFSSRNSKYFNLVEPYQHFSRSPNIGINVYSPSIYPEDNQPSSAINMSKIDQINMEMKLDPIVNSQNPVNIRVYTVNYNILRIYFNCGRLQFD